MTATTYTALTVPAAPEVALILCREVTVAWPIAAYVAREHWEVRGREKMLVGSDLIAAVSLLSGRLVAVDELPGLLRVQPADDDFPSLEYLLAEVARREPVGLLGLGAAA